MALNDFRAVCLPYCLQKQEDGTYVVLNREYKPLSFCTYKDDYKRQDLPIYLEVKGLTQAKIKKIISIGKGASLQGDSLFLYDDGSNPLYKENMKDYFERLALLMPLEIDNIY